MLIGISHSTCAATKYNLGHHQMNPPGHLSQEQVAFLVQFYPMLYSLPGGFEPNADLRRCVADLLWDYPRSMVNPTKCVHEYREQNKDETQSYKGDLEADYLRFLAKVQKAAKENPMDVECDFP
jgi:hypothetical protein